MKKYLSLIRYELKTIVKDAFNVFILLYPVMMLFICGYLIPQILKITSSPDSNAQAITLLISFLLLIAVGGYMMGIMLGFMLLDNRDENTLVNIAVSPITISGYATFKIIYTYVLAVASNILMVGGVKLVASDAYAITYMGMSISLFESISYGEIIWFSGVSGLIVPFIALIFAAFAKNKIEGFAFAKMGGFIVMIPLLVLLNSFQDYKQYILGLFPSFWPMKALLNEAIGVVGDWDLSFTLYLLIGSVYPLILGFFALKLFIKKLK